MVNYNDIISKADVIVNRLGYPLYKDEIHYGDEYKYDKLRVIKTNGNIQIFIDKEEVLSYDCFKETKKYKKSKWTEIIELIYEELSNIVELKEVEDERKSKKIVELYSLQDYLKFYVECYHEKEDIIKMINMILATNNILIFRETRNWTNIDLETGYTEDYIYYVFTLFSKGEKVLEFNDNKYDVFPNIDYYADKYKSESGTKRTDAERDTSCGSKSGGA